MSFAGFSHWRLGDGWLLLSSVNSGLVTWGVSFLLGTVGSSDSSSFMGKTWNMLSFNTDADVVVTAVVVVGVCD